MLVVTIAALVVACTLGPAAGTARAAPILYGADTQSPAFRLGTINPATAAFQSIGTFPFAITGLAYSPDQDELFGISPSTHRIYRINRATAAVIAIGSAPFTFLNATGLAYDSSRGRLLATANFESSNELFSIDPVAGTYTPLAVITGATNVEGLGYDAVTDTLYGIADIEDRFVRINMTTGVATTLATVPAKNWRGGEYDPFRNVFYISVSSGGDFYEINLNTPTPSVNFIGITSLGMQGLAITPEPAAAAIILLAGAPHCLGRRHRRFTVPTSRCS
jgi:hypothetical protein